MLLADEVNGKIMSGEGEREGHTEIHALCFPAPSRAD